MFHFEVKQLNIAEENRRQMKTMQQTLVSLRQRSGLTIEELATVCGIVPNDITALESGGDVDVDVLLKLCKFFDIKPKDIFLRIL